jgi:hypothetical protein
VPQRKESSVVHTQDAAVLLRSASGSGEPWPPVREHGVDCLGSPLNALVWLSGAVGPMVAVAPAGVFEADITASGSVTVSAEAATPTRKDS